MLNDRDRQVSGKGATKFNFVGIFDRVVEFTKHSTNKRVELALPEEVQQVFVWGRGGFLIIDERKTLLEYQRGELKFL
jgi:hypothetical protein